jgi:hypothetical protein
MSRPVHFMAPIREERLSRDRHEADKAGRKAEYDALPRHKQGMLLSHMDDLPDQTVFPCMEEP